MLIVSRRARDQKKYEEISENIFTRRVYRGLISLVRGKTSSKGEEGKFLRVVVYVGARSTWHGAEDLIEVAGAPYNKGIYI